jgi:hypothetical protein
MARTAFTQTPKTLLGVAGIDIFDTTPVEHPDVVNGNTFTHHAKVLVAVRNNHASEYITLTPVVQREVLEDSDALTISNPAPISIDGGEMKILGPLSALNFRKSDGKVELNWTLETGTITAADVDVALVQHP